MSSLRQLRKGVAALLAATLVAGGLVLGAAPAHAAEPVTVTDRVSGATITLSSARIKPGETIQISGTGFTPIQGSTGDPLVAVRPYDFDNGPAWTVGGADAHFPGNPTQPPASEAKYWFVTHHESGTFTGTLTAPTGLTAAGPLGNGKHWLRILSGAFFTTTGDRITNPITFEVPFEVAVTSASTGLTSPTGTFQAGTVFRPGAQVTVQGTDFAPEQPVTVEIDGAPVTSSITTDAEGALPDSARVAIPADIAVGAHTLRLATGAEAATVAFTVTAPPTATIRTTAVRPGGTITYDLAGYIGVGGAPQKVAVVVAEQVLKCVTVGSNGAASGTVKLPADISEAVTVGFNVGLSCQLPPTGVINDQPIGRIAVTLDVRDDAPEPVAPAVTVAASATLGGTIRIIGEGFTHLTNATQGSRIAVKIDDGAVSRLEGNKVHANTTNWYVIDAKTDGTFEVDMPLPDGTTSGAKGSSPALTTGSHTLRFLTGSLLPDDTPRSLESDAFTVTAPVVKKVTAGTVTATGTKKVGKTLTAKPSAWKPSGVTFTYQWLRNGKKISKATKKTYKLTKSDAGTKISVTVTGTKAEHTKATKTSKTVTIAKVTSTVKVTVPKSVKRNKKAIIKVTISSAVSKPTGKVTVTVNGKKVAKTVKTSAKGKVSITLPKISKKGSYNVKTSFAPSGSTAKSTAKSEIVTKTLKVV